MLPRIRPGRKPPPRHRDRRTRAVPRAHQPGEQEEPADDDRPRNRIRDRRAGSAAAASHSSVETFLALAMVVAQRLRRRHHRLAVLLLAQRRPHFAQHGARKPVGQDRLQPVADFQAAASGPGSRAAAGCPRSCPFAHAPRAGDRVGHVFDGLALAGKGSSPAPSAPRWRAARSAQYASSCAFAVGIDDFGEVADEALGFVCRPVDGPPGRREEDQPVRQPEPLHH